MTVLEQAVKVRRVEDVKQEQLVGGTVGGTDRGNRALVDEEVMSLTRRAARGKRCSRLVWQENKA